MTTPLTDSRPPDLTPDGGHIVVTGAAGFIGHHTVRTLLDWGYSVVGIDGFTDYYAREVKLANLASIGDHPEFTFQERMIDPSIVDVFEGSAAVIHLAAQPGVRDSWRDFDAYVDHNIRGTKYVLDAAIEHDVDRVVCASSSSVYGDAIEYPTREVDPVVPRSPYGITKLAAERLAVAYGIERGLSTVALRYFTVFGPGQRPDMAMHRLISAAHDGTTFPLFGDGNQIRDFTYVGDVARANALAALRPVEAGSVFNVCCETPVTLNDVIKEIEAMTGTEVDLDHKDVAMGDVRRTGGSADRIAEAIGWTPLTGLADGLRAQDAEIRKRQSC